MKTAKPAISKDMARSLKTPATTTDILRELAFFGQNKNEKKRHVRPPQERTEKICNVLSRGT